MNKKITSIAIAAVVLASSGYGIHTFASKAPSESDAPASKTNASTLVEKQTTSIVDIQNKMLNSIDNFNSIRGSYHIIEKSIGVDETIDFEVQQGSQPGSYVKTNDNKRSMVTEQYSDGQNLIQTNTKSKTYKSFKVGKPAVIDNSKPRAYKDANNEWNYVYRADPAVADAANDVVFPQVYAFWLKDSSATQITGHEKYLERESTVIEGNLEPILAEKHQAQQFKLWIDTETGVLLKLEETNASKETVNTIEVKSIEFNQPVDKAKFNVVAPAGFTQVKRDRSKE